MNESSIVKKSFQDFFTKEALQIIIYPILGTLVILYLLFFGVAGITLDSLDQTQIQIQQHEMQIENGIVNESHTDATYTGSSLLDFLLQFTITSWVVGFLVYTIGFFVIGYLSIFISMIIIGFLTPKILAIIHQRYYKDLKVETNFSILDMIIKIIKTIAMTLLLFFALFPLYFIPGINIIAINLPFYYFFHKMIHYDIASTITSKEQFIQIYYMDKFSMRARTLVLYMVSLIPFTAFFLAVFYIIYLGHVYFQSLEKLR